MARPTDDEQRCKIWDAIYRSGGALNIADAALQLGLRRERVITLTNHPWFERLRDGRIRIAYARPQPAAAEIYR